MCHASNTWLQKPLDRGALTGASLIKMLDVSRAKVATFARETSNISCDTTMTRSGGVKMLRLISTSE